MQATEDSLVVETLLRIDVATDAELREKVLEQLKAIPFEDDESEDDEDE